jgi:hypothetical protein
MPAGTSTGPNDALTVAVTSAADRRTLAAMLTVLLKSSSMLG